ncbi:hypothetical protein RMSM_02586 [Rhodopirellula maiorica SM1]|uniref:Uncharacterized protein n=1 Tax=Rhodopirellula maiorica SM1 TaxID=1265738 RepID=M5RMD1_9BACT|nr:hypothetical protein RMSM_02586 [Rhodopirellula maiorica SM1]
MLHGMAPPLNCDDRSSDVECHSVAVFADIGPSGLHFVRVGSNEQSL